MNTEEEAKARLEVAQLYVEMQQLPKAVRYFVAAAEIFRDAGNQARARELYQKVLEIEPDNAQVQQELAALGSGGAAAPPPPAATSAMTGPSLQFGGGTQGAPPAARPPAAAPAAPSAPAAQVGQLLVPTPWIFPTREQQAAILSQVTTPPDPMAFPFTPLPKVDVRAVQAKQEEREREEEKVRMKDRTRVESAFGDRGSAFQAGGGFLNSATLSTGRKRSSSEDSGERKRRSGLGGTRGGNQDLADAIRKRLQGG